MELDLQNACTSNNLPSQEQFQYWVTTALIALGKNELAKCAELTIRLVDNDEMQQLNNDYRGKDMPTNVLSFPFEPYDALMAYAGDAADLNLLGDIVIAPSVIEREATEQEKELINHYAHMSVHGLLHLLGYDHIEDDEAAMMESQEIGILKLLAIANPYEE